MQISICQTTDCFFYSVNQKSGCSTIKKSIGAKEIPYEKYFNLSPLPIFSVVRNPYSRFLSSFRYCCLNRSNEAFRNWPPSDCTIDNYLTFLESVSKQDCFSRFDVHQRPQSYNLCIDDINYDFIGKLEYLDEVSHYIASFGYKDIKTKDDHRTGAVNVYKKSLDSNQCSRIRKIFEKDFEVFQYSYDLDSSGEVKCLYPSTGKLYLGETFRIKLLIECLYMLFDDEQFNKALHLNSELITLRFRKVFGLSSKTLYRSNYILNPLIFLMIISGDDFNGRLDQIILSLVEPTDFDGNLQSEDIDIVIRWCENNELSHFLNTLREIKKYCHLLKFEGQFLHIKEQDNGILLDFKDLNPLIACSAGFSGIKVLKA